MPTISAFGRPGPCVAATARMSRGSYPAVAQSGAGHGQPVAQVLARGEFGHHAAVFGVQLDLRGNDVGQHDAFADHRDAGFVAGGFGGEEWHLRIRITGR